MTLYNVEEYECATCGNSFGPGDSIVEVWSQAEADEDGTWEGQQCDIYHSGCVDISDGRPPEHRLYETERTGTVHLMEGYGDSAHSLCRTVSIDSGAAGLDVVRTGNPSTDIDGCCETCARIARSR